MFQFKGLKNIIVTRASLNARSLNPELQTLDQWLAKNKSLIPLE
jgi:hypothetical protein